MSSLKPQHVATLVSQFGRNAEPQRLNSIIVSCLQTRLPGLSEEQIWEWTEEYENDVANELFLKESESRNDAVELSFDIHTEDDGYYIKFTDVPGLELLRSLQNGTPENFEEFCAEVLTRFGGTKNVTASSHDGGIDFWSSDVLLNKMPYPSTLGSRVMVVGQAKRYRDGNQIKEVQLREFVGAAVKKLAELKKTKSESFGILQPAILAFWTTSDFHINAKIYARELGIWYLNGTALCQLAAQLGIGTR